MDDGISIFFPVYKDESTVAVMVDKSIKVLKQLTSDYEVVIVNDGSPDDSGKIADQIASAYPMGTIRVIHHEKNKGYGAAVKRGISECKYKWICLTDGDDEYDVFDLLKLYHLRKYYGLIITFRYLKVYSTSRVFISWVYNIIFRWLFRTSFRDVSTGLRLIDRDVAKNLDLKSNSPFIGAEIAIKAMLKGYPIGEVGIQTFPRQFGKGSSTSMNNIIATIRDMLSIYKEIFSMDYQLPPNRKRN